MAFNYMITTLKRICLIIQVCFFVTIGFGQSSYAIKWKIVGDQKSLPQEISNFSVKDSVSITDSLQNQLFKLQNNGRLLASIDTVIKKDSIITAHLFLGPQYSWLMLSNGNVPDNFWSQSGFSNRKWQNEPINLYKIRDFQEKLKTTLENSGYPFSKNWLDSLKISEEKISAKLMVDKGKLIIIDSFQIAGNAKISKHFIQNYLEIKNGSLYNKSKIAKIKTRLKELPFLKEKDNLITTFTNEKATITLFLENKNASKFGFLIGLLPSNTLQQSGKQSFTVTGTINTDLYNLLGFGERIIADFQQLKPGTQQLKTKINYPYLFNTTFGVDTKFELFKRDSSNLDLNFDLGVQYNFVGNNYLKAYWNTNSSRLLSIDSNAIKTSMKLPNTLDFTRFQLGLEGHYQELDYIFNPKKGFSNWVRVGVGQKKVKKNTNIIKLSSNDFNFETLYDSISKPIEQIQLEGKFQNYIPISKYSCVKTAVTGATIISKGAVFQNENFRIGGNALMRGFNEASIFATSYLVGTVELRYLTAQNSYFYLFGDYGMIENKSTNNSQNQYLGVGAGITFDTAIGIFGISAAIGKQDANSFDFKSTKIHFGYVNLF